jgi:putative phage-type endonuclease
MSVPPPPAVPKRKAPMKVAHDGRPKEEPSFRVRHEPISKTGAIDRLLLLLERDRAAGGRSEIDLASVSAALGYEVMPVHFQARATQVLGWSAKLKELLKDPGVTQRTPEWYEARKTMVTASDVAQALGCSKFGNQRTFFQKKCGAADEQAAFDASLPPLKWGVMFEPVAQAIYSAVNLGVRVNEFGLLRHPTLDFVGASPDGISDMGIMLEIKCPWRRRIVEGELPMQYYYQIQAQLAVCGLEECDYFECEFFEVDGPDEPAWAQTDDGTPRAVHERGMFVEHVHVVSQEAAQPPPPPTFAYPPQEACATAAAMQAWLGEHGPADGDSGNIRLHWWVLRRQVTARVAYDAAFSDDMFARLKQVWTRTVEYRGDRQRYLDEVGVAAAPAPSSSGPAFVTDAAAVIKFAAGAGCAFVDDDG